jgi:uncharacterized membrane protein
VFARTVRGAGTWTEVLSGPDNRPGLRCAAMERTRRPVSLLMALACLGGALLVGAAIKAPCAGTDWSDGRQYTLLCYSDVVPLLGTEQLSGGRLPFLNPCVPTEANCDEYPVLTMYFMRLAAWMSRSAAGFFWANAVLLALCAAAIVVCLYRMGGRVLRFVVAPTLMIYAFMNWDLLAVALATAGLLAFLRGRDGPAGALLGLGAAAKFYPILLVVPLIAGRLRQRRPDEAIKLGWSAGATWVLVNLPFAVASPSSWSEFFRFNSARGADWDSLWFIGCRHVSLSAVCGNVGRINLVSAGLFVAGFAVVWAVKTRTDPDFPRWMLGFPLLVAFLLSNKVYSPQYGLWLLPWFALGSVSLPAFVVFEAADVAVFVTRFSFFGDYSGFGGLPFWTFETAVLVRGAILLWCVVAWARRREDEALPETIPRETLDTPPLVATA